MAGIARQRQWFGVWPWLVLLGSVLLNGGASTAIIGGAAWGQGAPASPRTVVDEYVRLVWARPVSVDVLRESSPAELPYARLRLIVAKSLDGPMLRGIDAQAFRGSGRVSRIELPLPAGAFRDRLDTSLRASAACSSSPSEEAFRTVDVWCDNTGAAGTCHPLIVKVWDDHVPDRHDDQAAPRKVLGRLCHVDAPFVAECQAAFDYQPTMFATRMNDLAISPDTPERMAAAIGRHRESVEAASRQARAAGAVRTLPVPGGVMIELTDFENLPAAVCRHEGTLSRIEDYDAFLGLADGVSEGSCLLSFETPFPIGSAALWTTVETVDHVSSIEVEASTHGSWQPLFRLGDRPTRLRHEWLLPASLSQGNRLQVRVRMKSAAGNVSRDGPRAFCRRLDVPISQRLTDEGGVLRLVDLPEPLSYASARRPSLQIVVQRDRISAEDLAAMLRDDRGEVIDVYAECSLDAAACSAIADHGGTIRFWALSPWMQSVPACLDVMVSGTGSIDFPRLLQITEPLAAVAGGGRKSLAFPAVKTADATVLGLLARCSGELALDGIERLSSEQASALGLYDGPHLSLATARHIRVAGLPSKTFLRAAVSSPGTLVLEGVTQIDESIAGILAAGQKHVLMDDVVELGPRVAAVLATARGGLSLDGVVSLDRESARELLTYSGAFLSLRGLRRVECRIDDLLAAGRGGAPADLATTIAGPSRSTPAERVSLIVAREQARVSMARGDLDGENDPGSEDSRIWMSPPDVTAIDALLASPGMFLLEPAEGDATGELDEATAAMLTRGRKALDVDGFRTITPDAFRTLCRSQRVISMSGLREIPDGCLPDLCNHTGPMVFLDGIGQLDEERIKSLVTLIEDDRISLTGAGIYNIRGLRKYAKKMEPDGRRLDGDAIQQFLARSDNEDWVRTGRIDPLRAMVWLLSREKVVFGTTDGKEIVTRDRNTLSKNSLNKLDKLAELAGKVSMARKALLFAQPEASPPSDGRR